MGEELKLQAKLGVTYGILIFAMLFTSTVAYLRMSEVNRITGRFISQRAPVVDADRNMRIALAKSSHALNDLLYYGVDPSAAVELHQLYRDKWVVSEEKLTMLQAMGDSFELGDDNARIRTASLQSMKVHELEDRIDSLISSHDPEDSASAQALFRGPMDVQEKALFQTLSDVIVSENGAMKSESEQVMRASRTMVWTLWIATLATSMLGGLMAIAISRRISGSVRSVAERADAIAQGDLTGAPLAIASKDEIGMLANAMQAMQDNLRLTIGTVARTAASVTGNAVSIGAAGEEMHSKMDEQNRQTEQTATAVQEMSATVGEVSRHAGNAAKNARAAAETARRGGHIVREMLLDMNSVAEAVRSTSSTILLLGEDSGRIGHIVSVIQEIARKTNLLALNAAIEAARAGEQGRGFAVVAGEVRRLAESSAEATSEISETIQGIQQRTHSAVASMAEGTARVEAGMITTGRAGEALVQIIGMAEQVDKMIAQIAVASVQQTSIANESSLALHSIHKLGCENLSAMSSSVANAGALRDSAVDLERQIERFQIEEDYSVDDSVLGSRRIPPSALRRGRENPLAPTA